MNTETAQPGAVAAPAKIVIKHRDTDAVLFEFWTTEDQKSSGPAMRAALESAASDGAYLRGANLRGAYLGGDLKLIGERPVFSVGPIGSRNDYFTAYITDKGIYLRAGCFFGTAAEFEAKPEETHGTNQHAEEYRAALELMQCHARVWTPGEAGDE